MTKFCADCKSCLLTLSGRLCSSSKAEDKRDLVTKAWPSCSSIRNNEFLCGKEGNWFEAVEIEEPETISSLWKKFLTRLKK